MKADLSSAVETLASTNENRLFPVYSLDPRLYSCLFVFRYHLVGCTAHCSPLLASSFTSFIQGFSFLSFFSLKVGVGQYG